MATALEPKTEITEEEFLALPDDGVRRWLIDGEVWVLDGGMTTRNWKHSKVLVQVGHVLLAWLATQPTGSGIVLGADAAFRIQSNPKKIVGIDVAYIDAELVTTLSESEQVIAGVPTLAVEILSNSDSHERVKDKIQVYREAGVKLIWIIDPDLKTITVIEQGKEPILFNRTQIITAEPYLPGFQVAVEKLLG